ncbi:MAG: glucuronate isomerase [Firmicutes bacterium HGW-Firmicutes-1]|jgi:glucuronate isomerase|nr:MAG: glucuronate isomerase [Firmicutes bacterium HGW-Firmicutes-1]
MKKFMNQDFLLINETSKVLYHKYAKAMPICDYHCHLSAKEIAIDKKYRNITELWLGGDHYKWRVLRSNGIDEDYITGDQSDYDKFLKWAETVPEAIGNPVYHWTHLELQRYFGINETLSPKTAEMIWNKCNAQLTSGEITARSLIKSSNVKVICTTDDPLDSLEYHRVIAEDKSFEVKVLPTFRPDKAINIELSWFVDWIANFESIIGKPIVQLQDLTHYLVQRIEWFHENGCFISDHALDTVHYQDTSYEEANNIFKKGLKNAPLSLMDIKKYKGYMLRFFGREYARLGWTMQYHIGALRNNSTRMLQKLGPDTGFDSINDGLVAEELSHLLNALDITNDLPKTILYCLNPRDNEVLATMLGNFQGGGIPGKMQFGSGWWFNDQKDGMVRQMEALSQLGLLSRFVGMVTDSRSFLSYTRHEYFRRILCNKIGEWVENGEYPEDIEYLGQIVENICFNNAMKFFNQTK